MIFGLAKRNTISGAALSGDSIQRTFAKTWVRLQLTSKLDPPQWDLPICVRSNQQVI